MIQSTLANDILPCRVAVYRFLRAALSLPTPEQHAWMRGPDFAQSLRELTQAFDVDAPEGRLVPEDGADHESRYLACFEVGLPNPPVPLLASHYQKHEPVPRIIHEHILYYRRFALPGPNQNQAPADHLVYQLAFLIHLDEIVAQDRVEAESAFWARQDFLSRHVQHWVAEASHQATEKRLPEVYRALLSILALAVAEDLEWTSINQVAPQEKP